MWCPRYRLVFGGENYPFGTRTRLTNQFKIHDKEAKAEYAKLKLHECFSRKKLLAWLCRRQLDDLQEWKRLYATCDNSECESFSHSRRFRDEMVFGCEFGVEDNGIKTSQTSVGQF
ncbi:hypothetical protein CHS0354_036395 [Potamilus streckersoni]|uniref:Uncharacterized protein n=1 Tax=Potamilus streckersoni TaxID=2493646 RepID=A0AAE0W358_9BIVA|nr:hypothetical protein CHS0354_036395 [Potamilus streckersoni]